MKVQKVSPIAKYLVENKAIPVRNGNNCHFFTKEGLLLGRQLKIEQDQATAYVREVYGEGLKRLFIECKVLGQKCAFFKNEKSPIGLSIMPMKSYLYEEITDFLNNKVKSIEKEIDIASTHEMIGTDEETGVSVFDIHKPYLFREKIIKEEEVDLDKEYQIEHITN